jgi:hypothetical protein
VARLDFNTLRQAIDTLKLDDKEQLFARVISAEKLVVPSSGDEDTATTKKRGK